MTPIKVSLQYFIPKHAISRLVGFLAAAKAGFITTGLIKLFIHQFKVDMTEAEREDPAAYESFNDFFTRLLKPGLRPIDADPERLVFPVDGTVSQLGDIDKDRIFQAKGHDYSLTALLGGKKELTEQFEEGKFATIYLSPRDYHRIHMPMDAVLTDMIYVPGELFSVNPLTTAHVPGLFARNERVVALFDTDKGKMAMVLVGATIVASIETIWAGTVTPPAGKKVMHWQYPAQGLNAVSLKKGEEMGLFKLGSTVVMLFAPDMLDFDDIKPADTTRLGVGFASLN
ncbi:archaetidylserine decarboxylase [Aliiglaciecola sp. CAU 1673]|uniref:archaetidylserine decarboxylase n=1 Tax=Aliiglaciecola sp. CAU 1673 TaxID=3032595 RepID=UPI0023DC8441|nr:archaetidylserine decarboxylase [Aliiglaciecola sp. CAU 1673]MDF2178710.1 archaetidylserine decarboxylase [Aliiglaciecola sp. CAU 1673]